MMGVLLAGDKQGQEKGKQDTVALVILFIITRTMMLSLCEGGGLVGGQGAAGQDYARDPQASNRLARGLLLWLGVGGGGKKKG